MVGFKHTERFEIFKGEVWMIGRKGWGFGILLGVAGFVHAAPAGLGAGQLLQDIHPEQVPEPSKSATGLTVQSEQGGIPSSRSFKVSQIVLEGVHQFPLSQLRALIASAEGHEQNLQSLYALAQKITNYYHAQGYPFSRAVIPPQKIKDGVVHIEVIEARYGSINLKNQSRVDSNLLQSTLSQVQAGDPIAQGRLDRTLLLMSDIPGVGVNATLKPGQEVGTAEFDVDAQPLASVQGSLTFDNAGADATGRNRYGANVDFLNPLHSGDDLSLSYLGSGTGMNYERVGYDTLVSGSGTHLGAGYSGLHYVLFHNLSPLQGHGLADDGSIWVKQTLLRASQSNVYLSFQGDRQVLKDELDATNSHSDRRVNTLTSSVSGDSRNYGGVNTWSLAETMGRVSWVNTAAAQLDAGHVAGVFNRFNLNAARSQNITQRDSLYAAFYAQWSSKNLDTSQKMVAGGVFTVQSYAMSVLSGDEGYLGTIEWRHELPYQLQSVVFWDEQNLQINRYVIQQGTPNHATLGGAGVGLNWMGPDHWLAKVSEGWRVGPVPAELGALSSSTHFWFQLSKGF